MLLVLTFAYDPCECVGRLGIQRLVGERFWELYLLVVCVVRCTVGKKTVTMFCKFDLWTIYLGRKIS